MVATGEFNLDNTLHMEWAWYTFSPLLQYELDQVKHQWNTHYSRIKRHDTIPRRPGELFFLPESSGGQNQGTNISDSEIDFPYSEKENIMEDATIVMNDVDEELAEYFEYVVHVENLLYPPTIWREGRELFIHILERASTQQLIKNVFIFILYFCIVCISINRTRWSKTKQHLYWKHFFWISNKSADLLRRILKFCFVHEH